MQPLGADEPTVVGPYRLLGRLGSGGMGRVYLGRSAGGRTVAVKIVHPHFALDEEFRARFRREVDAARRVGGAWTAPVLDADPGASVPWVATAYAAGPSLAAAVTDGGPLPGHSVRVLGAGLAEALAAVHELGLVHRDVKPSNVLLTLDGPLLIDFGIARATDGTASLTSTGVSIGSPGYMSPEQILGKGATGAADVFSLGAVLAYAATGEPPFPGDSSAALLYKVVHEEPELGPLDGELREVVESCLTKDPSARPAPGDLARRLAPDGAARLVAAGWLPGALVEQVSRGAVQLLNLEATTSGQEAASGPVGFSSVSVGDGAPAAGGEGAGAGRSTVGEFGPPPVMQPSTPAPSTPVPSPPVSPTPATPAPSVPEPRDAPPGKLSVSVAASSGPGDGGRGRRMSCTVALAVAGALAAVTVGSAFLFDLLPGTGSNGKDNNAGGEPSTTAPPSYGATDGASESPKPGASPKPSESAEPSGSAQPTVGTGSAVPASYLGTWEGQALALDGTLPVGTFRLTVHKADVGEELGRLRQTDQLGGVCNDILTVKTVTAQQIVATSVGAESNHSGCNPTPHTVRLSHVGDDLKYASDSEAEGNPAARMSKIQ
ncbi:serine/threonine protein kinase [Streptomyces spinosirectus]|uniref:serine/threonine-protein kinase n=1 Tax=Streptomyces TaxID=1883 RepID=UPI001C9D80CE|nr:MULTISPECIES: serine/threonine-protein kinase [Streptomyces]MBY8340182.1 serine/threonine protein kinase [Streptomyces plumbidurans]UIR18860.1 serine/threonine protein kinase [Streptomyces spinosirectus]